MCALDREAAWSSRFVYVIVYVCVESVERARCGFVKRHCKTCSFRKEPSRFALSRVRGVMALAISGAMAACLTSTDILALIMGHVQPQSHMPLLRRIAGVATPWRTLVHALLNGWMALQPMHHFSPQPLLVDPLDFPQYPAGARSPFKAAALPGGMLALTDDQFGGMQRFSEAGVLQSDLVAPTSSSATLGCCTSDEHIFIFCHSTNSKLLQLRIADGEVLDEVYASMDCTSHLDKPCAMTYSEGTLYVADTHNDRIVLFDTEPFLLCSGAFGSCGESPGQFRNPNGIAVYEGEIFISDRRNKRIQVLSLSGDFLRLFSSPARSRGGRGPKDLAIDASGRLLVVEADAVAVLTRAGELLQLIALPGSEKLTGIALSPTRAFVTECEKGRVHVLKLVTLGSGLAGV